MRDDEDQIETIRAAEWPAWLARANAEAYQRIWVFGKESPWSTSQILDHRLEAIERNPTPVRIVQLSEPIDEEAFQPWPAGLTELWLNGCGVTNAGLAHLAGLVQMHHLILWDNRIDATGLAHLTRLKRLQSLDLGGNQIEDVGLAHFSRLGRLQSLKLWRNRIDGAGLVHLAGLKELQTLDLRGNQINDAGLAHLAGLKQLQTLELGDNQIEGMGLVHLAGLKELQTLILRGNQINDAGLAHLTGLEQLQTLELGGNQIEGMGLVHFTGLKQLRSLELDSNQITGMGLEHLAGLQQLQTLSLVFNGISGAGLARVARLKQLRTLALHHNQIDGAGLEYLAGLTQLQTLDLHNNQIDGAGLEHLAGLTQLQTLVLYHNQIDGAGLEHLAGLIQLRALFLQNNPITSIIDPAILRTCDARQILAAVRGNTRLHHARILWIGMGGVGKSWLARRVFCNELIPPSQLPIHDETHDIQLLRPDECRWKPRIQGVGGALAIEPHIWDFAGQLVTHGVHESFLDDDGRTVYVLTLSARRDPDRPASTKHDERTWNRLGYWLQTIHHFVGPLAPVVLAITQCDDVDSPRPIDAELPADPYGASQQLRNLTPDEVGGPYGVAVTALVDDCSAAQESHPIEPLRKAIERALQTLSVVKDGKVHPQLPRLRTYVARELGARPFATVAEFAAWCRACEIEGQDDDGFLASLHYLGTLIHFGERAGTTSAAGRWPKHREDSSTDEAWFRPIGTAALQGHVFNPVWFKTCVYGVMRVTARTDGPARDGWLDEAALDRLVQATSAALFPEVTWDKAWLSLVREALVHIRLCWHDDRRRRYLFPRALPPLVALYAMSWPTCELVWEFLPEANVLRLLVELHRGGYVVKHQGVYQHGRNGALIEYPRQSGGRALVLGDPYAGRIELRFDPAGDSKSADRLVHWLQAKLEEDIQRIPVLRQPEVPRWGEQNYTGTAPVEPPPTIPTAPGVSRGRRQEISLGERATSELELQEYELARARWPNSSGTYTYAKHAELHRGLTDEEHQAKFRERLDKARHFRRNMKQGWEKYCAEYPQGLLLDFLQTRTVEGDHPEDIGKAVRAFQHLLSPPAQMPPRKRNK